MLEFTDKGVAYTWSLAGPNGAFFIVFPDSSLNEEDIKEAISYLHDSRDVVSIRIATDADRDELFKAGYFRDSRCRPLRWYEIEQDPVLIRTAREAKMTPEDFVSKYVIPRVNEVRNRNIAKFGKDIVDRY